MSTAHTPGPWSVSDNPRDDQTRRFIWNDEFGPEHPDNPQNDTAYCIATINPRGKLETLEANAHLIAAAPDLLAAAKLALQLIKDTWDEDHGNAVVGNAWGALHDAIAKAVQS